MITTQETKDSAELTALKYAIVEVEKYIHANNDRLTMKENFRDLCVGLDFTAITRLSRPEYAEYKMFKVHMAHSAGITY